MPWTAAQFREKHNKKLSPEAAAHAAKMANAILNRGGSESIAIATASKHGDAMMREHEKRKADTPR